MKRHLIFFLSAVCLFAFTLIFARPAKAQPVLFEAVPESGAVLSAPPEAVTLTFDRVLRDEGTSIRVTNEQGERVDVGDKRIDPSNRFVVSVPLAPLAEGQYTVAYTAAGIGISTVAVGSYTFTVDLPPARLELLTPVNGEAYPVGEAVPLDMRVDFFDFANPDNRIRISVDGEVYAEVQSFTYDLTALAPGVHQIETMLVQGDTALPETSIRVTIAIARPDAEIQGRTQAALAEPDPGLQLTPLQLIGVILVTSVLLIAGLWLGNRKEQPPAKV